MIDLYTSPTPNGWKAAMVLEELALDYTVKYIDLAVGDQHKPSFVAMNPNGRIPVIVDHDVKTTLRVNTECAINDGVFGVPSFVVNLEVFWGGDATDMLLDYLDNPGLFQTPEMRRISNMPMGKARR